jgi:hypothetical protein
MTFQRYKLQKLGSGAFALAALGLVLCAILWPSPVADLLRSRLAAVLLSIGSGGLACVLHPEVSAGLALGFREFRKATREVIREIRGDDDDGPHAV